MGLRRKTLRRHKRRTKRRQRGGVESEENKFFRSWAENVIRKQMAKGVDNKEIRELLYNEYKKRSKKREPRNNSKTLKKILYETFKDIPTEKDYVSYPNTSDIDFQEILAGKQEFYENRNNTIVDRCGAQQFQLTPHQQLLGNFITPGSIYKSVLLFHGTGTGKTCTAITIAENFTKQVKKNGKILVICGKSVVNNFYNNIFDKSKLQPENLDYLDYQCTGRTYYDMTDLTKKKKPEQQYKAIKKKIKNFYDIKTYYTFATELDKIKIRDKTPDKREYIKHIHTEFSNRVLIVDEVQALRDNIEGKTKEYKKKIPEILEDIAKYSNNTRFVLLSATPMFNDADEIIWLINLMRLNDNQVPIKLEDIFEDKVLKEDSIELLKEYTKGYISYLRGEDPINFPLRLYPHTPDGDKHPNIMIAETVPSQNFFGGENPVNNFEELRIFCNEAQGEQAKVLLKAQDAFHHDRTKLELSEISRLKQMSLLVCPDNECYNSKKRGISGVMGKITKDQKDFSGKKTKYSQYRYKTDNHFLKWNPDTGEKPLENYSIKFAKTLESIDNFIKSGNKGIVFVYCSDIEFGVTPFCLALEQYGFSNAFENPLLDTTGLDVRKISYDGKRPQEGKMFYQAKYIRVIGSTSINTRDEMIHASKQPENIDGSNIRVIVGSDVMSEGIDLKWVREVHVLDPWYHINKIEQIIGRGIRFCSHAHPEFPEDEKNVTVFLHSIKSFDDRDTSDIYLYREAWRKALQMGKIEKAMKESAIDCSLHKEFNVFSGAENRTIKTPYSDSIEVEIKDKEYSKICSYGDECNFTCMNEKPDSLSSLSSSSKRRTLNKDTYKIKHNKHRIKQITTIIRNHFKDHVAIDFAILSKLSSNKLKISEKEIKEIVIHSLNKVVESGMNLQHNDKTGKLVQKGKWYVFEETNKEDMSLYFRQHKTRRKLPKKPIIKYIPPLKEKGDKPEMENLLQTEYEKLNKDIQETFKSDYFNIPNKEILIQFYLIDRLSFDNMVEYYTFLYLKHEKKKADQSYNLSNDLKYQIDYIKDSFKKVDDDKVFVVFSHDWTVKPERNRPEIVPNYFSINIQKNTYLKIKKSGFNYHNIDREYKKRNKGFIEPGPLMLWKHTTTEGYRQSKFSDKDISKPIKGKPLKDILKSKILEDKELFDPRKFIPKANKDTGEDIFKNKKKLDFFIEMVVRHHSSDKRKLWYNNYEFGFYNTNL